MKSIQPRIVYKVFVAALIFQSELAGFQSLALNGPAGHLYEISNPPQASTPQPQAPTQDKQTSDAALAAFKQADALRLEGSAESLKKALEKFNEALQLYRALADRRAEAITLNRMVLVYNALGEKPKALDYGKEALTLSRAEGDRSGEATALNYIGMVYDGQGEKQKALDSHHEALPIWRALSNPTSEAYTLMSIGSLYKNRGEKQKALDFYNQALVPTRAAGDRSGEATALSNIAILFDALGEPQKALDSHHLALPILQALGNRVGEVYTLSSIGWLYNILGERQKALDLLTQTLPLWRALGDRAGEAQTLTNLGIVNDDLGGDKQKTLDYFDQALRLRRELGDRTGEASLLNNLGWTNTTLGEVEKGLSFFEQALPIWRALGNRSHEALTLTNLALFHDVLGEKQKALDYYKQALTLRRAEGNLREAEALTLNSIAELYMALGERRKAVESYDEALPIWQAIGQRLKEAETLTDLGALYNTLGEKEKALGYLDRAESLSRAAGDQAGEASALNHIGIVYHSLGDQQKALDSFNRALQFFRARGDREGESAALDNIGAAYSELGEHQKALDSHLLALPLKAVGDRAGEGSVLHNIATSYVSLGQPDKAMPYFTQALSARRDAGDLAGEAATLINVALLAHALGEKLQDHGLKKRALGDSNRALMITRKLGDRDGEATVLNNLMFNWSKMNADLAIYYGKQAVNVYQQLRANIRGLDKALQKTFLLSKEDTYRELADLLIRTGRLAEAQQVLGLLKEEEYFEFVRRDGEAALTNSRITFSPAEAELEKRFSEISDRVGALGAKRGALLALKKRTRIQNKTLSELESQLEVANQVFQKFLEQLEAELKAQPNKNDIAALREAQALQSTLRELDAVALYTIVGPQSYRVILITPDVQKAYEYKISEADLNKKVSAFQEALKAPSANPLLLAQELYRILIGPELSRDIAQTKRQTIAWSLDGALRYLPMAALHDGQKYLVENYRNVVITLASRDHLNDRVSPKWQALGLGVSKGETITVEGHGRINFRPLSVREELAGIVRDQTTGGRTGILPGKVILDADFTTDAMKTNLRLQANQQPYKLVHIASHFNFEPGDETKSFLLLGGGKTLTLAQLKIMPQLFSGVELLTLSACDTATGGERQGKEVEGFAVLAQRQGAQSIVASLWPVYDLSTSQLMQSFYRLRDEHPGMSKAEALRQAQLTMLHPEGATTAPFAHPHFWAPFILIGNWR